MQDKLNNYIDHTLLRPEASAEDIKKLCLEAQKYQFKTVCINSSRIPQAREWLKGGQVQICTVVGFPLGAGHTISKVAEARWAIEAGAKEIDMVLNVGWIKDKNWTALEDEISQLSAVVGERTLKVILETCLLNTDEIVRACQCAVAGKADYVKTSTGLGSYGATIADVKLMKETVGDQALVKASGGIRDMATALAMIEAGASRLGTSSGVALMENILSHESY